MVFLSYVLVYHVTEVSAKLDPNRRKGSKNRAAKLRVPTMQIQVWNRGQRDVRAPLDSPCILYTREDHLGTADMS